MANDMSRIEFEACEYVQQLMGKDSIMLSTKQTSVRLDTGNLAIIDALAELGKKSRNQIINDALDFGLRLIREQFDKDDNEHFFELLKKQYEKPDNESESDLKIKKSKKGEK